MQTKVVLDESEIRQAREAAAGESPVIVIGVS